MPLVVHVGNLLKMKKIETKESKNPFFKSGQAIVILLFLAFAAYVGVFVYNLILKNEFSSEETSVLGGLSVVLFVLIAFLIAMPFLTGSHNTKIGKDADDAEVDLVEKNMIEERDMKTVKICPDCGSPDITVGMNLGAYGRPPWICNKCNARFQNAVEIVRKN